VNEIQVSEGIAENFRFMVSKSPSGGDAVAARCPESKLVESSARGDDVIWSAEERRRREQVLLVHQPGWAPRPPREFNIWGHDHPGLNLERIADFAEKRGARRYLKDFGFLKRYDDASSFTESCSPGLCHSLHQADMGLAYRICRAEFS
jgi:hypothetical protein